MRVYCVSFRYRPVGVLGQTVGHDGAGGTAADHYEVVLVTDLGDLAVRQPVVGVLDVGPEEQYGHADEHYVADAGPVRHGYSGGKPGRERVRRHARWRRPVDGHCRRLTRARAPRLPAPRITHTHTYDDEHDSRVLASDVQTER